MFVKIELHVFSSKRKKAKEEGYSPLLHVDVIAVR
jgi:hypothetical protein